MKQVLAGAIIIAILLSASVAQASGIFRAEVHKMTQTCGEGKLIVGEGRDIYISPGRTSLQMSFSDPTLTNEAARHDLHVLQYGHRSENRSDFVAIGTDRIRTGFESAGEGFVAMYGKVLLNDIGGTISIAGKITQLSDDGIGGKCVSFLRFRTMELVSGATPNTQRVTSSGISRLLAGSWVGYYPILDVRMTLILREGEGEEFRGLYRDNRSGQGTVFGTVIPPMFPDNGSITLKLTTSTLAPSPRGIQTCPGSFVFTVQIGENTDLLEVTVVGGSDCFGTVPPGDTFTLVRVR
tara:strand:+ start:2050 stop:2934 length:885 start_codon:yes stop_codon:yes gene_type:complete